MLLSISNPYVLQATFICGFCCIPLWDCYIFGSTPYIPHSIYNDMIWQLPKPFPYCPGLLVSDMGMLCTFWTPIRFDHTPSRQADIWYGNGVDTQNSSSILMPYDKHLCFCLVKSAVQVSGVFFLQHILPLSWIRQN